MPPPEQLEASVHLAHCRDDKLAHLDRLDSLLVHGSQQSQRRDAAAATAGDAISCPTVSSASSQSGDCGMDSNGDVSEHMDSSYMVCTLGRNRKPSRKLQEAVHDYQADPADPTFQFEMTRLNSLAKSVGCSAPQHKQRRRGWKARREEESQYLIKVKTRRFSAGTGKGVPGLIKLDDYWVKCVVGGRVDASMVMREVFLEDGRVLTKYVHSLAREDDVPEDGDSMGCVLEPIGSEAWGDVRCGRHILVQYDDVYYMGIITWHRKSHTKAWHICFEDGEELDLELPAMNEEEDAILMPLSWSEAVTKTWHDGVWWGHIYADMLRSGEFKSEKISMTEMEDVVNEYTLKAPSNDAASHFDKVLLADAFMDDDSRFSGWGDWASKRRCGDSAASQSAEVGCDRRNRREEVVLGGKLVTIDELNHLVSKHGGYDKVTKSRQWTALSDKLGIKTMKGSGVSLRRWYAGYHGMTGESSTQQRMSIQDQLSVIARSAIDDPISAHREGLRSIFGPIFQRNVDIDQKYRRCAIVGQTCVGSCTCEWLSFSESWKVESERDNRGDKDPCRDQGVHDPDFDRNDVSRDGSGCEMEDALASRRCCGTQFLRRKDMERHWKEQHTQGVGVCMDGYRDPRQTSSLSGTKPKSIMLIYPTADFS